MLKPFPFLRQTNCSDSCDTILFQTSNFCVVPTRGALVEGWVLIVPKDPVISFGFLPTDLWPEAIDLLERTRRAISTIYGGAVCFEHGPVVTGTTVGCGVDHAHLHVLPFFGNVFDNIPSELNRTVSWRNAHSIKDTIGFRQDSTPYLYFEDDNGARICDSSNAPSQFFRRVIAAMIGKPNCFDWKDFPMTGNVDLTVEKLATVFDSNLTKNVKQKV